MLPTGKSSLTQKSACADEEYYLNVIVCGEGNGHFTNQNARENKLNHKLYSLSLQSHAFFGQQNTDFILLSFF